MKEKLHPAHVAILIYMIQVGVVIISMPRMVAQTFGYNGWLMLIVFTFISALNIGFISAVYKLGKGQSIFEILERSLTKFGAFPLYIVFIAVWSLLGCLAAKQYVFIYQTMAFPTTHPMFFKLMIDIVAFYLLIKGIYSITKTATAFFWISVWMLLLLLFFVSDFEVERLTPFLLKGGSDVVHGSFNIYTGFLGYELSLLLIPYVDPKSGIIKAVHFGNMLTGIVYTVYAFVSFGFYSYGQLITTRYPMLDMFSYIRLPFVERIESLFFGFFFFATLMTIVMYIWSTIEVVRRIVPKTKPNFVALILLIGSFVVSWFPDTLNEVKRWLQWLGYAQFSVAFGLPILLILLLYARRWKERKPS